MRNWYGRKYIVHCAPVSERRGRTFERKLAEIESRGYKMIGRPRFTKNFVGELIGVVMLVKISKPVKSRKMEKTNVIHK